MLNSIFWNYDHISRTYSWINHINIWFAKVIIILIRTIQVLIFDPWSSDLCLNVVEREIGISCIFPYFGLQDLLLFYWQYLQKIWFLMVVLKSGKFVIVMEIIWKQVQYSISHFTWRHERSRKHNIKCERHIYWRSCYIMLISFKIKIGSNLD